MSRKKRKSVPQFNLRTDKLTSENLIKAYYSIGEVAKMFGVEEAQLRYWEEHTSLSPKRSSNSGARLYSHDDIQLVDKIRYLLFDKGLSLQAVEDQLSGNAIHTELEIRNKLLMIRDRVEKLRAMVDKQLDGR